MPGQPWIAKASHYAADRKVCRINQISLPPVHLARRGHSGENGAAVVGLIFFVAIFRDFQNSRKNSLNILSAGLKAGKAISFLEPDG